VPFLRDRRVDWPCDRESWDEPGLRRSGWAFLLAGVSREGRRAFRPGTTARDATFASLAPKRPSARRVRTLAVTPRRPACDADHLGNLRDAGQSPSSGAIGRSRAVPVDVASVTSALRQPSACRAACSLSRSLTDLLTKTVKSGDFV
jgi:hypothetical protein